VALVNNTKPSQKKPRLRHRTDRAWFSRLLRHSTRKQSGSIHSTWSTQQHCCSNTTIILLSCLKLTQISDAKWKRTTWPYEPHELIKQRLTSTEPHVTNNTSRFCRQLEKHKGKHIYLWQLQTDHQHSGSGLLAQPSPSHSRVTTFRLLSRLGQVPDIWDRWVLQADAGFCRRMPFLSPEQQRQSTEETDYRAKFCCSSSNGMSIHRR